MATTRRKKAEEVLLDALARGATPSQAAEMAGVHRRTVHRRLADPEFKQKLRAVQADMVQSTANLLTAAGAGSVKTLVVLQDPSMPPSARFSAARAILELGPRWREAADGEERLAALEALAETIKAADSTGTSGYRAG